jgi:Protein of unknown function (DUF295)
LLINKTTTALRSEKTLINLINQQNVHPISSSSSAYCTAKERQVNEQCSTKYEWVKSNSLDDEILILGFNCSTSLLANLHPNFRGNCIYFKADDEFIPSIWVMPNPW